MIPPQIEVVLGKEAAAWLAQLADDVAAIQARLGDVEGRVISLEHGPVNVPASLQQKAA